MITILALICPFIVLAAKLYFNYRLWHNKEIKGSSKKIVNHPKEWALMALACSPSIYHLATQLSLPLYFSIPLTGAMVAFVLWVLFDGFNNVTRGFFWFYTGSIDNDDAATDKFLRKYGTAAHTVKYVLCAGFIIFYLKYFL